MGAREGTVRKGDDSAGQTSGHGNQPAVPNSKRKSTQCYTYTRNQYSSRSGNEIEIEAQVPYPNSGGIDVICTKHSVSMS